MSPVRLNCFQTLAIIGKVFILLFSWIISGEAGIQRIVGDLFEQMSPITSSFMGKIYFDIYLSLQAEIDREGNKYLISFYMESFMDLYGIASKLRIFFAVLYELLWVAIFNNQITGTTNITLKRPSEKFDITNSCAFVLSSLIISETDDFSYIM